MHESVIIVVVGIVCTIAMFVLVGFLVWIGLRARQRRLELQAEVQTKVIDRFTSAPEMIEFLQSPAGHEFIASFQNAPRLQSRSRMLKGIRSAIVLTFLGIGLIAAGSQVRGPFLFVGLIVLFLGIANIVGAIVSMRLSKSWGILPPNGEKAETP
jgi:Flp pilus assembly protein TadB